MLASITRFGTGGTLPPLGTANTLNQEDDHVVLHDALTRRDIAHQVVQPDPLHDPDSVVLVVDGQIVVEYRKVSLIRPGTTRASVLMAQANKNARRCGRPQPFTTEVRKTGTASTADRQTEDPDDFKTAFEAEAEVEELESTYDQPALSDPAEFIPRETGIPAIMEPVSIEEIPDHSTPDYIERLRSEVGLVVDEEVIDTD
jgi:hypothetical protein